jgi:transcription termination factor Rho
MAEMKLQELKSKSPTDLLACRIARGRERQHDAQAGADVRDPEAAGRQDVEIIGEGVVEVLQDGFGFLRSPIRTTCPVPTTSMSRRRRSGASAATGDTVEGPIRGPKDGERYFALLKVNTINFDDPEKIKHKIHFDNLTPLYPDER